MSFYVLLLVGTLGGVFGGMGMGGGTLTIPLLTLLCGIPQNIAQGVNLLSFLPMSLLALSVHKKSGRLQTKGLCWLIFPALLGAIAGSLVATRLPSLLLRKLFGGFLIVLSVFEYSVALKKG